MKYFFYLYYCLTLLITLPVSSQIPVETNGYDMPIQSQSPHGILNSPPEQKKSTGTVIKPINRELLKPTHISETQDHEDVFTMVNYLIQDGQLEQAREYLSSVKNNIKRDRTGSISIMLLKIQALAGEQNLQSRIEGLNETAKPEAYFTVAESYEKFYARNTNKTEYSELIKLHYVTLISKFSKDAWANRARLKMASIYSQEKEDEQVLNYLVPILQSESQELDVKLSAWYRLGWLFETSQQYKNYHKAIQAYKKILTQPKNIFTTTASTRINYIRKYYLFEG